VYLQQLTWLRETAKYLQRRLRPSNRGSELWVAFLVWQTCAGLEGTPIKLKADKGSKLRGQERCKARTKAGCLCRAPAVERSLCFCAHPEKLAELGRQGGKMNRRWKDDSGLPHKPLKSAVEVRTTGRNNQPNPARPIRSSCRECDWVLIRDSSEGARSAS
jgi:hypothetical protein